MVKLVLLNVDGDINDIEITLKSKDASKKIESLLKFKKTNILFIDKIENKGTNKPKIINKWNLKKYTLIAYGYLKGNIINNHELPPYNNNNDVLYGDILMMKVNSNGNLLNIDTNEYEKLYNKLFYKEEESDEDNTSSDNESIVDSDIDEDIDDNIDEDEEINSDEELNVDSENEIENNIDSDEELNKTDEEDNSDDESTINEYKHDINNNELNETSNLDKIRLDTIDLFNKITNNSKLDKKIEESIFKYTCELSNKRQIIKQWDNMQFKKIYFNKCRSIYANLDKDSYIKNPNLLKNIISDENKAENIGNLNCQELFPEHWKTFLDNKYKRLETMYEDITLPMTDMYRCGRCKQNKCSYYELQTRSADEGMTTFIMCLNCGNRWKN